MRGCFAKLQLVVEVGVEAQLQLQGSVQGKISSTQLHLVMIYIYIVWSVLEGIKVLSLQLFKDIKRYSGT